MYSYVENPLGGKNLKLWNSHGEFEPQAMTQLYQTAALPVIFKHVAGMPDVHLGYGATVGSVIATDKAIIPSAVGVDIGCGMCAVRTTLTADDLPDNLGHVRAAIEQKVPHGRTGGGRHQFDKGGWKNTPNAVAKAWRDQLSDRFDRITDKHKKIGQSNSLNHLGTLGGGNHFIEVCLDEDNRVWVMLHSGSRGVGNSIGRYFIDKAMEEMEKYRIDAYLPNKELAYLVEHTENFDDYVEAMMWAQDFASINRKLMLDRTLEALREVIKVPFQLDQKVINCHHNYAEREHHFGEDVWVTRKGAVRARRDDMGIIPGSMGAKSFIVRGLGNADSFCSCSHGAGRVMSRSEAKRQVSIEDHAKALEGIEARVDESTLDETPSAYKDIDAVMSAQTDLVEVVHTLRQVVNIKG